MYPSAGNPALGMTLLAAASAAQNRDGPWLTAGAPQLSWRMRDISTVTCRLSHAAQRTIINQDLRKGGAPA